MSSREMSNVTQIAADLRTLAFFLAQEPNRSVLEKLDSEEGATAFGEPPIRDLIDRFGLERVEDELAVEYAQLFIIPGEGSSPVESIQRGDGQYLGPHAAEVLATYRSAGFDLLRRRRVVPDHISVELDFVAHLLEEARFEEAWGFTVDRLLEWVPQWVERFSARAHWRFYPLVARRVLDRLYYVRDHLRAYFGSKSMSSSCRR